MDDGDGDDPWVMACLGGGGGDLSGQVQGPSNHRPLQGLRQIWAPMYYT